MKIEKILSYLGLLIFILLLVFHLFLIFNLTLNKINYKHNGDIVCIQGAGIIPNADCFEIIKSEFGSILDKNIEIINKNNLYSGIFSITGDILGIIASVVTLRQIR